MRPISKRRWLHVRGALAAALLRAVVASYALYTHTAVSPDGQRFLLTVSTINQTMVAVVQNWLSAQGR